MTVLPHLDLSGAWYNRCAVEPAALTRLGSQLDKVRDEICDVDEKILAGEIPLPPSKRPLQARFVRLPEIMLDEYQALRPTSQLGRMLAATKQLMTDVDRIVVFGDADYLSGPMALMQACCQPYFNELTRGQRGSRPRLYFMATRPDNDAFQGLLHLLGAHHHRPATALEQSWGLVVLPSRYSPHDSIVLALRHALLDSCGGDSTRLRARTLSVSCPLERQSAAYDDLAPEHCFMLPKAIGAKYSVLTMAGLLPAALLGINIMQLLEGAQAISRHFFTVPSHENLVLQWAGINYLMDQVGSGALRGWCAWHDALEGVTAWYHQLLYGSLGKPLQVLKPCSIQGLGKHHLSHPKLVNHIIAQQVRFDPLVLTEPQSCAAQQLHTESQIACDPLLTTAATLPQATRLEWERAQSIQRSSQWPATVLSLSQLDERQVGQILQLLMLATVVEGRMMGCNPYA